MSRTSERRRLRHRTGPNGSQWRANDSGAGIDKGLGPFARIRLFGREWQCDDVAKIINPLVNAILDFLKGLFARAGHVHWPHQAPGRAIDVVAIVL